MKVSCRMKGGLLGRESASVVAVALLKEPEESKVGLGERCEGSPK